MVFAIFLEQGVNFGDAQSIGVSPAPQTKLNAV